MSVKRLARRNDPHHLISMLRRALLTLLLLGGPAAAADWRANYLVTVAGLPVMEAEVNFTLGPPGTPYAIETRIRSRGLAAVVLRGEQRSRSEGGWQGGMARPRLHESNGNWRGTPRHTLLHYDQDGAPRIVTLEPARDMERTPVPEDARRGTIDSLTALVQLTQQVSRTARCDTRARTFDGRRLTQFNVTTDPVAHVTDSGLLRCLVESRLLAGVPVDRPIDEAMRPIRSELVFGVPQPGAPAIPVRIEIASRWWGAITATLISFGAR